MIHFAKHLIVDGPLHQRKISSDTYPRLTRLTIHEDFFDDNDQLMNEIQSFPLCQINELDLENEHLTSKELFALLEHFPNVCKLTLSHLKSMPIETHRSLAISRNHITQFSLNSIDPCKLSSLKLVLRLFPRLTSLEIAIFPKDLSKLLPILSSAEDLFFVSFLNMSEETGERFQSLLSNDRFFSNSKFQRTRGGYSLWWK